ncbi:DUF2637 domain-containing protein [Streptomyces scabiei]
MNWNPSRALAVAAGLVIVALTAAAFWLSYAHLAEVALANGMENKEIRAWAWPATLDLFIVAGELLMLRAALAGEVDRWAIGLTVVGSGSSIALNVAGVGTAAGTLDYVVAAVPPTAALLAFGALMRQIHQALAERAEPVEVTAEVTTAVTVERAEDDQPPPPAEPTPVVIPRLIPGVPAITSAPFMWDSITPEKVTTHAAAEPRKVVTEVVTLSPAELRRRALRLHREAVTSGKRGVTIDQLREEFGLSRRDATELRRETVEDRS